MSERIIEAFDTNNLERMVDVHGLGPIIATLAHIAGEKAAHLATNWQDTRAAKRWDKASVYLSKVADHSTVEAVTP